MQDFPAASLDADMLATIHEVEARLSQSAGQPIVLVAYTPATKPLDWHISQTKAAHGSCDATPH